MGENDSGNILDKARKILEILTAGHDTNKVRFLRKIDNTAVVELFFVGSFIDTFTKFVSDGNFGVDTASESVLVSDLGQNLEGFFGIVFREVRRVIKDPEEGGIVFDGENITRGISDTLANINTKVVVGFYKQF